MNHAVKMLKTVKIKFYNLFNSRTDMHLTSDLSSINHENNNRFDFLDG